MSYIHTRLYKYILYLYSASYFAGSGGSLSCYDHYFLFFSVCVCVSAIIIQCSVYGLSHVAYICVVFLRFIFLIKLVFYFFYSHRDIRCLHDSPLATESSHSNRLARESCQSVPGHRHPCISCPVQEFPFGGVMPSTIPHLIVPECVSPCAYNENFPWVVPCV